ncbi:MAG: ABC transporter substrate-binding protein [Promethearchaeota archaeon]
MSVGNKEHKKKGSKLKKLVTENKPIVVGGLIASFAIAGIIGGIYWFNISQPIPPGVVLVVGVQWGPFSLDPIESAFDDSIFYDQVAEGLFDYNYSSEFYKLIPNLAINHWWSENGTELTCVLRQGVKFHDDTSFDATAVQWNFDRLYGLIDSATYGDLWLLPNGKWIINKTQILNETAIKFLLNAPYAPLEALLATPASYILSPSSTPKDDFIDLHSGDLVGTGPFIYDNYVPFAKVTMSHNPNYWGGKPKVDRLIFSIVGWNSSDPVKNANYTGKAMEAMLSGKISIIPGAEWLHANETMFDNLINNPNITLYKESPGASIQFIIMNNKLINKTMRKAISYAINYSYINERAYGGEGLRCRSPIPRGMLYSNNEDFNTPYYNVSIARQILIDAKWNRTSGLIANNNISAGNEWEKIANSSFPLATYNFTYQLGFPFAEDMSVLLTENLKQIGVKVATSVGLPMWQYLSILREDPGYHRDMLELSMLGWGVDYNDPSDFINPLFTNKMPAYNWGQVNDTQVQQWMDEALFETNQTAREQLYYKIQERLIEVVYPYAWTFIGKRLDVYLSNLRGWNSNPYKKLFKSVYFS